MDAFTEHVSIVHNCLWAMSTLACIQSTRVPTLLIMLINNAGYFILC